MAENSAGSPVFADRYRIDPIDDDWDTGRTGFTHPAYDIIGRRRVVIKRADVTSPQAKQHEHSLQNEAKALDLLRGTGVPELYAVSEASYGQQKFTYLVMEYVTWVRVEKDVLSLKSIERVKIILQLFCILAKAHDRGIANGDIDIKHLFWNRDEQKLCIIDWGNASIIQSQKNHQLSFDMARSAEIIYALVTQEGIVPVTGVLSLPANNKIVAGLLPLPQEFYKLCKWAPRNPSEEMHPPYSALEMYAVTKDWLSNLYPEDLYADIELDELIKSNLQVPRLGLNIYALTDTLIVFLVVIIIILLILIFMISSSHKISSITPFLVELFFLIY